MQEKVLILDFGSQYTQLIARRVRELNTYCEIHPFNKIHEQITDFGAVILSGSPFSVRSEDALHPDLSAIRGKKPLLAVCYGAQYLAHFSGGQVQPSNTREYGRARLSYMDTQSTLFANVPAQSQVWMSHSDTIEQLPEGGVLLASTEDVKHAAYRIEGEETYALQFHPEVYHSTDGKKILENQTTGKERNINIVSDYNISNFSTSYKTYVTIGTFDGVQFGHLKIIDKLVL